MFPKDEIVVFTPAFIKWSSNREPVPLTTQEAFWGGPWAVAAKGDEFIVHRTFDPTPIAYTRYHETALLVAAILPIVGRGPLYWFSDGKSEEHGMYELQTIFGEKGLGTVGRFERRHEEILVPLSTAEGILRCSGSLAFLVQAAPREILKQVNHLIVERLAREEDRESI